MVLFLNGCFFFSNAQPAQFNINFDEPTGTGSPYVFGATQPRGLSDQQWDQLRQQGFTLARSQADLSQLVPCSNPQAYHQNTNGCADPANWDWHNGIYGNDFVKKASSRGMRVILTIKNAHWNRYPNTPEDEETIPKDFQVWADIITKIINHYKGAVSYLELFNEVDRVPQFLVENSGYTRKKGYQKVLTTAIKAVQDADYPKLRIGGPAAANIGKEQVIWLLEDPFIRTHLGMISFHDFDNPEYPHQAVMTYKSLLDQYNAEDVVIVRSSFVPEYEREKRLPGTLYCAPVAHHLIGGLKDGLEAMGLWEIQNKTDPNDVRYWFDQDNVVNTASLYKMMSVTLKLGQGNSRIFKSTGRNRTSSLAAINPDNEMVVIIAGDIDGTGYQGKLTISGLSAARVKVEMYKAGEGHDGSSQISTEMKKIKQKKIDLDVSLNQFEVLGLRITPIKSN
ncbi:MAG: hypothetical protein ACNS62_19455 [Candidatus Cyclobacteriaceae bacterium M3_2C_046]